MAAHGDQHNKNDIVHADVLCLFVILLFLFLFFFYNLSQCFCYQCMPAVAAPGTCYDTYQIYFMDKFSLRPNADPQLRSCMYTVNPLWELK